MVWNKIVRYGDPMNTEIAVLGFPGMANVGEQTITYLVKELSADLVARIYSEYLVLPQSNVGISILEDGRYLLPSISIFQVKDKGLTLVMSDVQPLPWGSVELAKQAMDLLTKFGVSRLVVITGFVDETYAGKVITFGNDQELVESFVKNGAVREDLIKSVVGLAGSFMAVAKIMGLKASVLSGVAPDYSPDPKAAKSVLQVLDSALNLSINFEDIDKQIEELEKIKREIVKEIERRIKEEMAKQGGVDESEEYVG